MEVKKKQAGTAGERGTPLQPVAFTGIAMGKG